MLEFPRQLTSYSLSPSLGHQNCSTPEEIKQTSGQLFFKTPTAVSAFQKCKNTTKKDWQSLKKVDKRP